MRTRTCWNSHVHSLAKFGSRRSSAAAVNTLARICSCELEASPAPSTSCEGRCRSQVDHRPRTQPPLRNSRRHHTCAQHPTEETHWRLLPCDAFYPFSKGVTACETTCTCKSKHMKRQYPQRSRQHKDSHTSTHTNTPTHTHRARKCQSTMFVPLVWAVGRVVNVDLMIAIVGGIFVVTMFVSHVSNFPCFFWLVFFFTRCRSPTFTFARVLV